jgi:hypothetical protein
MGGEFSDLYSRIFLAVTKFAVQLVSRLILNAADLWAMGNAHQFPGDHHIGNAWGADVLTCAVAEKENLFELNASSVFTVEEFNVNDVALLDFVLFSTRFNNGVHFAPSEM